jgi:uncharacterized protein (DUF1684 family)
MITKPTRITKPLLGLRGLRALREHRASFVTSLAVASLIVAGCSTREVPYEVQVSAWRAEKDRFMRESSESPVTAADRAAFPALPYFPINQEYRVPAALKPTESSDVLEMPTSTGQRRRMRRIGALEFTLKNQPLKLTAFADANDQNLLRLFVPFNDLTNGTETYPGGRYLDLDRTATGIYDLDFNRAYNPFCLFNPTFDCPVPPRENRLTVPIRAGEKVGRAN